MTFIKERLQTTFIIIVCIKYIHTIQLIYMYYIFVLVQLIQIIIRGYYYLFQGLAVVDFFDIKIIESTSLIVKGFGQRMGVVLALISFSYFSFQLVKWPFYECNDVRQGTQKLFLIICL
eukprot:TRINITY_DN32640_c0_g2_i10.p4 TRINITY_DN32640_c0_g2~~TRINITY_DN32640_c0_g2_i10.p4  ORF type:complete len:119 (-),score=2.76 TRINITY_DN32640_c0_g2_i10:317-673(-)